MMEKYQPSDLLIIPRLLEGKLVFFRILMDLGSGLQAIFVEAPSIKKQEQVLLSLLIE